MKKVLKWIAIVVVLPVVLVAMLAGALYIPAVQNWAVQKVARVASEKTGMDISVGDVRVKFPLDVSATDVQVIDQNGAAYYSIVPLENQLKPHRDKYC